MAAELSRKKFIECASKIIASDGIHGLSIRKIAKSMDLSLIHILDNIAKVKASISGKASKYKLVALENQTKGNGYYVLPANWDSLNVIDVYKRQMQ